METILGVVQVAISIIIIFLVLLTVEKMLKQSLAVALWHCRRFPP